MAAKEWVGPKETGNLFDTAAGSEDRPSHNDYCPYDGGKYEDCIPCQIRGRDMTIEQGRALLLEQIGGW